LQQSFLQRLISHAEESSLTPKAVELFTLTYPALVKYKTIDDYRENLRRDPAAIAALCDAATGRWVTGALYLLLIGSGYRLRLAETVAPDPSGLLKLLWEAASRCPAAPYRWVLGRCLEARRAQQAEQKRAEAWVSAQAEKEGWTLGAVESGKADPETDFKLREMLEEAISGLAPQQRAAIVLYLQGYNYREIADKLQISPKTADNAVTLAKNNLKKKLKIE